MNSLMEPAVIQSVDADMGRGRGFIPVFLWVKSTRMMGRDRVGREEEETQDDSRLNLSL